MTDMIERVARAIYPHVAWAYRYAPESGYDGLNEHAKETLAGLARAAIEAMREPTPVVMDEAPRRAGLKVEAFTSAEVWRAMIDAALNPPGEPGKD